MFESLDPQISQYSAEDNDDRLERAYQERKSAEEEMMFVPSGTMPVLRMVRCENCRRYKEFAPEQTGDNCPHCLTERGDV